MRLRHIEIFNAVMLTGSVSGAARLLHITQPAVSRTLQHAELQLGFALFERAGGRLVPTAEARALFPLVERLFDDLDAVRRLAGSLRAGRGEHELRVLTVLAMGQDTFPRAVAAFRARHPEVILHHQALHSPQIVESLALLEADLGVVFGPCGHPALVQVPLHEVPVLAVVPHALLSPGQVQGGCLPREALQALPVIGLDARDPAGRSIDAALGEGTEAIRPVMVVQTHHVALALANQGLGVALVDACTAASADRTRTHVLPLAPGIPLQVSLVHAQTRPLSQVARAFVRCMQQVLQAT